MLYPVCGRFPIVWRVQGRTGRKAKRGRGFARWATLTCARTQEPRVSLRGRSHLSWVAAVSTKIAARARERGAIPPAAAADGAGLSGRRRDQGGDSSENSLVDRARGCRGYLASAGAVVCAVHAGEGECCLK